MLLQAVIKEEEEEEEVDVTPAAMLLSLVLRSGNELKADAGSHFSTSGLQNILSRVSGSV